MEILKTSNPEVWRLNLMHDRGTLPVDQVRFRIDWSGLLARQHDRTRKAVAMLAAGHKRCEVADHPGCTPSAITQRTDKACGEWESSQGEEDEEPHGRVTC